VVLCHPLARNHICRLALALATLSSLAFSQTVDSHARQGQSALKSGDSAEAERQFEAVLALDPKNVDARANLGVIRYLRHDWAGAAEHFREVLKLQPLPKAQALLGMCEKRLGKPAEARRLLEQAWPALEPGRLHTQAGLDLLEIVHQAGDSARAAVVADALQRSNPTNPDVLYAAYRVLADLANNARDALAFTAPDSARMQLVMAQQLVNEGDLAGALLHYRKALQIDPELHGVHYELGETILQHSQADSSIQEAEKEFQAALRENPGDAGAQYRLGRIQAVRTDFKGAILHYQRALDMSPDHANAHAGMGEALLQLDQPQKALEYLLSASRLDPLNLNTHYRLAMVYRRLGRETDARDELTIFARLKASRQHVKDVYQQMHRVLPD
jgi:tetratricopeptide (TPR) repeat protein